MADRRVAITGLGVVTPAGIGIDALWEALLEGRRAVGPIRAFDASGFPCRIGGELEGFSARKFVPKNYRKSVKVMARDIEIAVAAADLAFRDAGLATSGVEEGDPIKPGRSGCNIGAGLICADLDELGQAISTSVVDGRFDLKTRGAGGMDNLTPLWLLKYLPNMLACHVTIIHGIEGPSNNITCGGASSHLAALESARWIARGEADLAVAGGAESKLNPMGLLRQGFLGRLCTRNNEDGAAACRPFDAGHAGTVIGEGGGLVILEEVERARARGARVYAELAGAASACDPDGIEVTRPTVGSIALAARKAMDDAGIGPEDVGLIVTHGSGAPGEDSLEAAAWREALGDAVDRVPAAAITGAMGDLFAGAGGVELAVAAKAVRTGTIPPTINFVTPAEGCGLAFSGAPRDAAVEYALTGAFATGGQSGVCVLKRSRA